MFKSEKAINVKKRYYFNQTDHAVANSSLGEETTNMFSPKDTIKLYIQCTFALKCNKFTPTFQILLM